MPPKNQNQNENRNPSSNQGSQRNQRQPRKNKDSRPRPKPQTTSTSGSGSGSGGSGIPKAGPARKQHVTNIAATTLQVIEETGSYTVNGMEYVIKEAVKTMCDETELYEVPPYGSEGCEGGSLAGWDKIDGSNVRANVDVDLDQAKEEEVVESQKGKGKEGEGNVGGSGAVGFETEFSVVEASTLDGARSLYESSEVGEDGSKPKVGVLAFASAKNPGGGFLNGAQAQEESLARSTTVYPSLMTPTGNRFYRTHRHNNGKGYYSHSIIYSPNVLLLRSDSGAWLPPVPVDMLTSCAVNAGVARREIQPDVEGSKEQCEARIARVMKERMGRILRLFEKKGVRNVVLGSFGTGVFRNNVDTVARIWMELLVGNDARFKGSFERVVFAILGTETYETAKRVFEQYGALKEGITVVVGESWEGKADRELL